MSNRKHQLHNRIPELDLLRGIAVLLMIFDHFMYDLAFLMPSLFPKFPAPGTLWAVAVLAATGYWGWIVRTVFRYVILAFFLLLTGICCTFSKSNLIRGAKLFSLALALSFATFGLGIFTHDPDVTITFGVLHCISIALLLVGVTEKRFPNKWLYLAVGTVLTAAGAVFYSRARFVSYNEIDFLPAALGQFLGIMVAGGDSFPFPLFGGQIFIGVWLGKTLYPTRRSLVQRPYRNTLLTFIGRNSLWVYFAHQIILPLLLGGILLLSGY